VGEINMIDLIPACILIVFFLYLLIQYHYDKKAEQKILGPSEFWDKQPPSFWTEQRKGLWRQLHWTPNISRHIKPPWEKK